MSNHQKTQHYARLFDLPCDHSLTISESSRVEKDRVICETSWLEEHDSHNKLIARFRTWNNRSLQPPYRRQEGWERYSLSGNLLDREIRYTKRDNMDYVH